MGRQENRRVVGAILATLATLATLAILAILAILVILFLKIIIYLFIIIDIGALKKSIANYKQFQAL